MKRQIRPATEELGSGALPLVFSAVWYTAIAKQLSVSDAPTLLLFAVAGLLPLYTGVRSIRSALLCRRRRAQAISSGRAARGRIVGVTQKLVPVSETNGRLRFHRQYCLRVELFSAQTGAMETIESQPYRRPIHRYLASTAVQVYADPTRSVFHLDGFQWKRRRSEPDIIPIPFEWNDQSSETPLFSLVFVAIAVLLLIRLLT